MTRVLVVEDEPTIRAVVAEALRERGYSVETAADGAEALATVRQRPPHVVLLDLVLPAVDGRAFVEACRRDPTARAVPIAVMSALDGAATAARRLPVQGFVRKPFDLERLAATVASLAGATQRPPDERASPRDSTHGG
jgi:CheY-like chemotaxis protein